MRNDISGELESYSRQNYVAKSFIKLVIFDGLQMKEIMKYPHFQDSINNNEADL